MDLKYVPIERKVILASYMRSGSSITGKILEQNQDTFYVFEPLLSNTLVKTIRMRISSLEPLLEKYPELKIIHLIRDPRAIVLSKSNLAPKRNGDEVLSREIEKASTLCKDMLNDLEASERLVKKYPEQS
ncbi:uncharacterized protein LOC126832643 [Patella vulgata]|uniref:uncharacterized protein LOC126832643 n=1 Tax=Patella vulgata TaxID=6465 RepID=UPI00217F6796|nr:uncharacterized protein LOC126832643 [Patella vulgata]